MTDFKINGTTFRLDPWDVEAIDAIEKLIGTPLLSLQPTYANIRALFFVTVRGQNGIVMPDDVKRYLKTHADYAAADRAMGPLLQAWSAEMLPLVEATNGTTVGNG